MNHRLTLARALRDPALYSRTRIKNEDLDALGLATLRHNHCSHMVPQQHQSSTQAISAAKKRRLVVGFLKSHERGFVCGAPSRPDSIAPAPAADSVTSSGPRASRAP